MYFLEVEFRISYKLKRMISLEPELIGHDTSASTYRKRFLMERKNYMDNKSKFINHYGLTET